MNSLATVRAPSMLRPTKQTVGASIDGGCVSTATSTWRNKGSRSHKQTKDTACNPVLNAVGPCVCPIKALAPACNQPQCRHCGLSTAQAAASDPKESVALLGTPRSLATDTHHNSLNPFFPLTTRKANKPNTEQQAKLLSSALWPVPLLSRPYVQQPTPACVLHSAQPAGLRPRRLPSD